MANLLTEEQSTTAAPQSPRLTALQNLRNQLPVANQQFAQGLQAARDIQLQQAVAKAPVGAAIAPTAQQTAGAAVAQTGQQQVERAQQSVSQEGQVGQAQLQEQQLGAQQQISQQERAARQQQIDSAERLGRLDMAAKKEVYDNQMKFEKDEAGRTLFNERQLADYLAKNAQSEEELKNYVQQAEQLNRRKLQVMETAYNIIMEDLRQKAELAEQAGDQQAKLQIAKAKDAATKQMQKKQAEAANRSTMFGSIGTVVGTVAGAVIGGPTGAMIGGQMGGAIGTGIS